MVVVITSQRRMRPWRPSWAFFWVIPITGLGLNADMAQDSLSSVWKWSIENEPAYGAEELRRKAAEISEQAVYRERWPTFSVEAAGDYGQRVRPGEERDRGLAGRGDILARLEWTLVESSRGVRERAVALRRAGLVESGAARDVTFRAMVGRTYVEAAFELDRHTILGAHRDAFQGVADLAELRVREGVEPAFALEWLEGRIKDLAVVLKESGESRDLRLLQLGILSGRAVSPHPVFLKEEALANMIKAASRTDNPAVAALRLEADAIRSEAEAAGVNGLWQVTAFGAAGPYFSEAFDRSMEAEYFGGVRLTWSPDTASVRQSRALAERHRARALREDARSQSRKLERRIAEIERVADGFANRTADLNEAVHRAAVAVNGTRMRWEEGLGGWREWLDAKETLVNARLKELDWRHQCALLVVEYAEITNRMPDLPGWLGQSAEGDAS